MPESIIQTLRFEKKADGWFDPPIQTFDVQHEVLFSAARVTVAGEADDRNHEFSLFLSVGPNNTYVNSCSAGVPDKKPSVKGVSKLSRLVPGLVYNADLTARGFSADEHVLITFELLELDSTVADVTRDILRDAESEPDGAGVNALAFGFSEASFAHLMVPQRSMPEVDIGPVPFLKVKLSMESLWFPWYPIVYIDVAAEELVVTGHLQLAFYRTTDPAPLPQPVAVILTQVSVRCRPAMVTEK
jgi:hypothetical protein